MGGNRENGSGEKFRALLSAETARRDLVNTGKRFGELIAVGKSGRIGDVFDATAAVPQQIVRLLSPLIRPDRNAAEIRSGACWILGSIGKVPSSVKGNARSDSV